MRKSWRQRYLPNFDIHYTSTWSRMEGRPAIRIIRSAIPVSLRTCVRAQAPSTRLGSIGDNRVALGQLLEDDSRHHNDQRYTTYLLSSRIVDEAAYSR